MTIREAIGAVDRLKPNTCSDRDKRRWLWEAETLAREQITALYRKRRKPADPAEDTADTAAPEDASDTAPFDDETPADTVLTVPAPYDQLYLRYLEAQIDYHNGEFDRYNNAIALFQTAFDGCRSACLRQRAPVGATFRYF